MLSHLAALLLAIMICILNSIDALAHESAFIDITEKPQYSLEVLCNLPHSVDLQVEISYRGEIPSVAFITPDGVQCEINRMNWLYSDNCISISIPNADAGCWYIQTLAEDKDRISMVCQDNIAHSNRVDKCTVGTVSLLLFLVCIFMIFTRNKMHLLFRNLKDTKKN